MEVKKADTQSLGAKGWIMVIYLFLCYFLSPSISSGFQRCIQFFQSEYGWDTTLMMSLVSIGSFAAIATCFIFTRMVATISLKRIEICFALVVVCGLVGLRVTTNYTFFCILEVLVICAVVTWAYGLNPVFVSRWFPGKKGFVMGIATMGIPIGSGLISKIIEFVGSHFGQQNNLMFSLCLAVLCFFVLLFATKDTPEQAGYAPDNDASLSGRSTVSQPEDHGKHENSPWTILHLLATKETWFLALSIGGATLFGGGIMNTNFLYMTGLGYSPSTAGNLMLYTAACAAIFSYLLGLLDAKKSPNLAMKIVFLLAILSCVFCLMGSNFVCLLIGLACGGAVVGGASNFLTSLTIEYWGQHNFARAYSVIFPIHQILGSMGALYITLISANFGGYHASYMALLVLQVVCVGMFSLVRNGNFVRKQEAKWEQKS